MVFFSERSELSGGDRRAAGDAPREKGIKEGIWLPVPESHPGISICDERFADPVDAASFEHAELAGTAVLRLPAHFCERSFASRGKRIRVVDERGGRGRGDRCASFRGKDELQRAGEMDCGDVDDLRNRFGDFLAIEGVLAVDGGAVGSGILRYRADGGDKYDFTKPRAGPIARANHGGLRDDVHGGAADRVSHCRRRGETYRRALYAGGVWNALFSGERDLYFPCSYAIAAPTGCASNRLGRIRAVEPGGLGDWIGNWRDNSRPNGI